MKVFKKGLAVVLVLLMFVSVFVGCQNNEANNDNKSTSNGAKNNQKNESSNIDSNEQEQNANGNENVKENAEEEFDIFEKYDPGITLTSVKANDASVQFREGTSQEDNPYRDLMIEKLGVTVEYDWVVDRSQGKAKMATMLASNSAPDFYQVNDPSLYVDIVRNGLAMDIKDIYDKYASEALKAQDEAFKEGYESTIIDGKMYGIALLGFGLICEPNVMWLREDWLNESGLEIPKTIDDVYSTAKTFMDMHEGSYGLAVDKSMVTVMNSLLPIMNAYGAYSKVWTKKDGKIVYGSVQPEMKDALLKIQELYSDGVIDREFSVKDADKVHEDIASSKVGIVGGANWLGFTSLVKTVQLDSNATWLPFEMPSANNEQYIPQAEWPVGHYWVINPECEHPEAVIKMLSLYMEEFEKGTFFGKEYDGVHFDGAPIYQSQPAGEYNDHIVSVKAFESGNYDGLTPRQKSIVDLFDLWAKEGDPAGYGRYMQQGPTGAYTITRKYVDNNQIMLDELRGPDPEALATVKPTLEKMEDDVFTRIIMGESIDIFDDFVVDWYKLGGEDATDAVNEMFN